jgi:hypothetical protein
LEDNKINLEFLKKSKKHLRPGDIFVLKPKGHDYYFGRVINTTAQCGFGPPKAILIYIYNATSKDKNVIPELDKNNLLIPPDMVNRLGWSRGYFENVSFKELTEDQVLKVHCFWAPPLFKESSYERFSKGRYMNEKGEQLDGPCEPVGQYGLGNYRVVDIKISKALGIPLPEDCDMLR